MALVVDGAGRVGTLEGLEFTSCLENHEETIEENEQGFDTCESSLWQGTGGEQERTQETWSQKTSQMAIAIVETRDDEGLSQEVYEKQGHKNQELREEGGSEVALTKQADVQTVTKILLIFTLLKGNLKL